VLVGILLSVAALGAVAIGLIALYMWLSWDARLVRVGRANGTPSTGDPYMLER
jgi:hypothetical protein